MIQRIQTLWLFLAAALMGLMLLFPLAEFVGGPDQYELTAFGLSTVAEDGMDGVTVVRTVALTVLIIVAALLPLVNIFLFKKRFLQFRLCMAEIVLLVGVLIIEGFYVFRAVKSMAVFDVSAWKFALAFFFPLIAILFIWLAIRGIMKDIKLLKSLDRIR